MPLHYHYYSVSKVGSYGTRIMEVTVVGMCLLNHGNCVFTIYRYVCRN